MDITQHAIERFKERVTFDDPRAIRLFIETDIHESEHLYRINNIEKRIKDGIIYVLDWDSRSIPSVITLYLSN